MSRYSPPDNVRIVVRVYLRHPYDATTAKMQVSHASYLGTHSSRDRYSTASVVGRVASRIIGTCTSRHSLIVPGATKLQNEVLLIHFHLKK